MQSDVLWLIWHSGKVTSSLVSTGIGELWRVFNPVIYPGPLSLAIPPWVLAMVLATTWEETVSPVLSCSDSLHTGLSH